MPKARVVPTALLAVGGGKVVGYVPTGLDQAPKAKGDAFIAAPSFLDKTLAAPPKGSPISDPAHLFELGLTTASMGFHTAAIEALQNCVAAAPDHAAAWRKLAELLRLAAQDAQAAVADSAADRASPAPSKHEKPVDAFPSAKLEKAERKLRESIKGRSPEEVMVVLRERLVSKPLDAAAMRLLAQLEAIAGDQITCMRLLERALDICPDYVGARQNYVELLVDRRESATALAQTTQLVAKAPDNNYFGHLHAHALMQTGKLDDAIDILARLLRENPGKPQYWLTYAQALHFMGRREESVQAYRHCLDLQPNLGEAYWGMADLKGNLITDADIEAMRALLEGDKLDPHSRVYMLYALGQGLERAGDFEASFLAYDEGSRLSIAQNEKRSGFCAPDVANDRSDYPDRVRRLRAVFSSENLRTKLAQAPAGAELDTPIFIIGLPRAGSTLVEQILASHSQVEGTRELPLVGDIMRDLALSRMLVVPNAYPERVLDLNQDQLAALGARYVERARDYRNTQLPYFIDKRPWNWLEVGLIHLILPHAKIIDIRREPMAACFGMFKQLLPSFSYDLRDLGLYYNKYVSMMEHWQSVMPGRVHFLQYERLVNNTEDEIRRMLDYCGLPFEGRCVRFWETERAVSTPSAEQVRRPIFRHALQQWRNFEPWLGPLKDALSEPVET